MKKRLLGLVLALSLVVSGLGVAPSAKVDATDYVTKKQFAQDGKDQDGDGKVSKEEAKKHYISIVDMSYNTSTNLKVVLNLTWKDIKYVRYQYRTDVTRINNGTVDETKSDVLKSCTKIEGNDNSYPCFSADGYYEILIQYNDVEYKDENDEVIKKDGPSDIRRFWIDTKKPTMTGNFTVTKDLNYDFNFKASDDGSGINTLLINNQPYTQSYDGSYKLSVDVFADVVRTEYVVNKDGTFKKDDDGNIVERDVYQSWATFTLSYPTNAEGDIEDHTWEQRFDFTYSDKKKDQNIAALFTVRAVDYSSQYVEKKFGWDNTPPKVSGVESDRVYTGTKKVTVSDTSLSSLTVKREKGDKSSSNGTMQLKIGNSEKKLELTVNGKTVSCQISDDDFKKGVRTKNASNGKYKITAKRSGETVSFTIKYKKRVIATYSTGSGFSYTCINGKFTITSQDQYGNVSNNVKNVIVDNINPKLSGFKNGRVYKKGTSITVTGTDELSGADYLYINGEKTKNEGKDKSVSKVIKDKGFYNVMVKDRAGNQVTKSFTIR